MGHGQIPVVDDDQRNPAGFRGFCCESDAWEFNGEHSS